MNKRVVIMNNKGIHARTAAMIAAYVHSLTQDYDFDMTIRAANGDRFPITSMLALASLKIKKGDSLSLEAEGKDAKDALDIVSAYISGEIDDKLVAMAELDFALEESTLLINQELLDRLRLAEAKVKYYEQELEKQNQVHEAFEIIVGQSNNLKSALKLSSKAAATSATVVLRGESGTGKELVAKAIHLASKRAKAPFIKVNCAAIPENLLESELFGHEKGAFTGASGQKLGKMELANGGTLFLDEIGELNFNLQAKILRALQEKEIQRVGGNDTLRVDVRIISATHRNLEEMVAKGSFREDLYYRLNVIAIDLPPLRARKDDIRLLTAHLIQKIAALEGLEAKGVTEEVFKQFMKYNWPGNIRELENVLTRGLTLAEGPYIDMTCIPPYLQMDRETLQEGLIQLPNNELARLEDYDRAIIKKALERHGSYNKAAKVLGITHRTVALKAQKYQLTDLIKTIKT